MTLLGDKNCAKLTIQWDPQGQGFERRLTTIDRTRAPRHPIGIVVFQSEANPICYP